MKRLKVLHIQLLPLLSGVQRVSLNEINEITIDYKDKFDFTLVCSKEGPLTEELAKSKVTFKIIKHLKRNISPINDLLALYNLYKFIKKEQFDIVHTHSSKTGFIGRIAAKLSRTKKIVHTVHGFSFPASKSFITKSIFYFMEWLAKFCTDELLVLNQTDYNIAIDDLGYNKGNVNIVPNGVNTSKFTTKKTNSVYFRIVMVGRLWEQKNPMCLINAAKYLIGEHDDIKIDFIGDGELRDEMETFINSHGLDNQVQVLGWSNNVEFDLPNYNLFVLPSLWEGMPLAILEAQACGLPAIVSNIPGNSDLVIHGVNGFLFDKNNVKDLVNQIKKVYLNKELQNDLSKSAREGVCTHYSHRIRNDKVVSLYLK